MFFGRYKSLRLAIAGFLAAVASALSGDALAAVMPHFEEISCQSIWTDSPARCGDLIVAENRNDPQSRALRLPVIVLLAEKSDKAADPVIFINGGPGGASIPSRPYIAYWLSEKRAKPWLARRDFVLFDSRGAGRAKPSLNCPEAERLAPEFFSLPSTDPEGQHILADAMLACRARLLAAGVDLRGYNTLENAADVLDLAAVLGFKNWNIYGASYGTRVALVLMRDKPVGLRSVILDSVYPPNVSGNIEQPAALLKSLEGVSKLCKRGTGCAGKHGSFIEVVGKILAQLAEEPHSVEVAQPGTSRDITIFMDVNRAVTALHRSFYSKKSLEELPEMALGMQLGRKKAYEQAARLMAFEWSPYMPMSEGVWQTVQCADEGAVIDVVPAGKFPGSAIEFETWPRESSYYELCDDWGVAPVDASLRDAVHSDVPTLLLSGGLDPVTSPAWARTAAQTLSNSVLVVIPWSGHGVLQMSDCASQIAGDFIDAPEVRPDTSCTATEETPWD